MREANARGRGLLQAAAPPLLGRRSDGGGVRTRGAACGHSGVNSGASRPSKDAIVGDGREDATAKVSASVDLSRVAAPRVGGGGDLAAAREREGEEGGGGLCGQFYGKALSFLVIYC